MCSKQAYRSGLFLFRQFPSATQVKAITQQVKAFINQRLYYLFIKPHSQQLEFPYLSLPLLHSIYASSEELCPLVDVRVLLSSGVCSCLYQIELIIYISYTYLFLIILNPSI